jgi:Ca2+/H+ antiporter
MTRKITAALITLAAATVALSYASDWLVAHLDAVEDEG